MEQVLLLGLDIPNLEKIAKSFNYNYVSIKTTKDLIDKLPNCITSPKLTLCEIRIKEDEILEPKCSVIKTKSNKLISAPIEDMSPLFRIRGIKKTYGSNDIDPVSIELRKSVNKTNEY